MLVRKIISQSEETFWNFQFLDLEIGTQELLGKATWEVSIARGMISRAGKIQFTVQYLKTRLQFTQPIDLSKRLKIKDLQIDLGNIQIL